MDAAQSLLRELPPADLSAVRLVRAKGSGCCQRNHGVSSNSQLTHHFNLYLKNLKHFESLFLHKNADAVDAMRKQYQLPFEVMDLAEKGERPFLCCQENRVADDKHRSPWTNKCWPYGQEAKESPLRGLERMMNEVWDSYKNLYYGSESIGSVYLVDSTPAADNKDGNGGFSGVFCIHKDSDAGVWSGIHHVQVTEHVGPDNATCSYRVESAVVMILKPNEGEDTQMNVSASMTKEPVVREMKVQKAYLQSNHVENLGTIIEEIEMELRSYFETVCLPKTQAIIVDIQKEPLKNKPPGGVNPLMGMMMNSDMLKKRLAKQAQE
jgi:capping protein beta